MNTVFCYIFKADLGLHYKGKLLAEVEIERNFAN